MELLKKIETQILNPIIGLLIAWAVIVFLYGVAEFIAGAASDEKREIGKRHMIWGVIGLFVCVAVFGIMNVLANIWK